MSEMRIAFTPRTVRTRRELAQWTDRDLHDVGLSRSDVLFETEKPFWRA